MIEIIQAQRHYLITMKYDREKVANLKALTGARWNPEDKMWIVPVETISLPKLEKMLGVTGNHPESIKKSVEDDTLSEKNEENGLSEDVEEYIKHLRRKGYSSKTIKSYKNHLKLYLKYCIETKQKINASSTVKEYIFFCLEEKKNSHTFANQAINSIQHFFKLKDQSIEKIDIERPAKENTLPKVLSGEDVLKILNAHENLKHKLLLNITYSAGLRVGEVCRLKLEDIDFDRKSIRVTQGKGRKDRISLLSANVAIMIKVYVEKFMPRVWLFEGQEPGKSISERTVQAVFQQAMTKAGVKRKVGIHSLRHSFATHLLENGTDIRYIQELLGHQSCRTTEIYTHVSNTSMLRITNPLDRLLNK